MRICLVGKYPPWQGGTSAQTLWLAYRLIQAGCEVSVITLPPGPEDVARAHLRDGEWELVAERFPALGAVRLVEVAPEPPAARSIPRTDAYVTRLVAAILEEVDAHGCEAVVGVYLEPFGLAAGLAAQRRNLPLVLIPAGSDLHRLAELPSRRAAYAAVIAQADGVVTTPEAARQVLALGGAPDGLIFGRPLLSPRDLFTEPVPPLGLPVPRRPVIGMYGKLGPRKGVTELLEAAARLAAEGCEFSIAFMTAAAGDSSRQLRETVDRLGLSERVALLPFLPPWRVPEFLAACDCIAFLENRFGIAVHRPQIPREVATAGRCLILSAEVAAYQPSVVPLADGENVVLVEDPLDSDALTGALRRVVGDPDLRDRIAAAGPELYRWSSEETSRHWTREFISFCRELADQRRATDMSLQAFQTALLRIYADPRHRERLLADPTALDVEPDLDEAERDSLEALLADRVHLERYCRGLMSKKLRALERSLADVLALYPQVQAALRERFPRDWVLRDRDPATEQLEFTRLVGECGTEVLEGEELRRLEQWLAYRGALASVRWREPAPGRRDGAAALSVNPAAELVCLQGRPVEGAWDLEAGEWHLAIVPDPATLQGRAFELTGPVWRTLAELGQAVPAETLVDQLAEGDGSEEVRAAAAGAVEHLVELGVLT